MDVMSMLSNEKQDIQQQYNRLAPLYDLGCSLIDLAARRSRAELLGKAHDCVLDVAGGTGANLPYLRQDCAITAVDLSPGMLSIYRKKAQQHRRRIKTIVMDAENLNFPDQTFDCVVETCGLCTFPNPVAVLKEMKRVCRSGGKILLLDHGRSSNKLLHSLQECFADWWLRATHCHLTRDPLELLGEAGLPLVVYTRLVGGILYSIEAES